MAIALKVELASLRQGDGLTAAFEGRAHEVPVSFFEADMEEGGSVPLHRHPYAELWIVADGEVAFTVDGESGPARIGEVVIVPAGIAHCFQNTGRGRLQMTCIHASDTFITEWL
ncbi:cupin domain-containing protein [Rhizobium leguminosarum]|uniref:cupin domain-containing protein n=1 Tax=Rhizobium leguminosarum TaxID=384 RepID=UPI001C9494AF|nr:cupin domain-containing protein [Rhizobium leguminosarum]